MKELDYIRVVLVQPSHPGNIGATARAMANMGVNNLVLVDPADFPSPIANARAAGADGILENAKVVSSIDEALEGCTLVIGTTARSRYIQLAEKSPEKAISQLREVDHPAAALVFGRENSGLTNQELERCNYLVRIPVEESFSSLNLGSAVTVILYEVRKQFMQAPISSARKKDDYATADEMRHFYDHLEQFVELTEFSDGRSQKLHRKIARLFNRVQMYAQEVRMLRGLFRAVEDKINRKSVEK